ncbi:low molecular weight phosphotyrosine protein phosphatase-like [Euroglyphus maynei]|uniref:Low molecular weight phosphotyrosine protein phosphatase n=1 Tax=Euroglyphus maynei TaxID=6958 RepID=A0A1Y3BER9_EURMA|nr:low molecular weight phosphotyrosine protein phosphatase-like [Euroglyphus maynei]
MSSNKRGVLFVCLGNICRSPIAEAVFQGLIEKRNLKDKWFCDSAATASYHTGELPDHRALQVLKEHGLTTNHKARKLTKNDFTEFEWIFGMDESNISNIKRMAPPNSTAKIELLGSYDPEGQLIIEDPYYQGGIDGFIANYDQCLRCCEAFLDKMN